MAHQVSAGDLLITKMGDPPGDACLYPQGSPVAIITADCIKLRASAGLCEPRFLLHAINSRIIKTQILGITKGVAQLKVSLGRFAKIACPLPPFAEQLRVVAEVERRLSVVEELEAVVNVTLQRTLGLRQSTLRRAFRGDLLARVPATDPIDNDQELIPNDQTKPTETTESRHYVEENLPINPRRVSRNFYSS